MDDAMTVNLSDVTGQKPVRNLSGKERGLAARITLGLDQLDSSDAVVQVIVPEYVDTISPSFFQGLFSQSITHLKGKESFLKKYKFVSSKNAQKWIEVGIRNATSSRGNLI